MFVRAMPLDGLGARLASHVFWERDSRYQFCMHIRIYIYIYISSRQDILYEKEMRQPVIETGAQAWEA